MRHTLSISKWVVGLGLLIWGVQRGWVEASWPPGSNWVGTFFLMMAAFVTGVQRWHDILREAAIQPSWLQTFDLSLRAGFFNTFLPGGVGGDVYRTYQLKHSAAVVAWTVWIDRWSGLWGLVLIAAVVSPYDLVPFRGVGIAGLCVALMASVVATHWMQKKLKRTWTFRSWARALGWSLLGHILTCLGLWISFGPAHETSQAWRMIPVFLLATSVPLLPAGIGTGHMISVALFGLVGMAAQPASQFYSLYASALLAIAALGGFAYLVRPLIRRRRGLSLMQ